MQEVDWKRQPVPRRTEIDRSVFAGKLRDVSLPEAESLASYAATPKWYSPSAANLAQPTCDLDVCAALWRDDFESADMLWLSCLMAGSPIMVRHCDWPADKWCLSLGRFGGTMALGWPVDVHSWVEPPTPAVPSSQYMMLSEKVDTPEHLEPLIVIDEEKWLAMPVRFMGPLHQAVSQLGVDFKKLKGAVRMSGDGPAEALVKTQARQGFPGATKALLTKLVKHRGLDSDILEKTLFGLLWCLVKDIVGADDEKTLAIVHRRAKSRKANSAELLELGECIEMVSKSDQKDIREESRALRREEEEASEFKAEYKAKKKEVKKHRLKGKVCNPRAKGGPLHGIRASKFPIGKLTQKQVQTYAPPRSHTWRSSRGSWQVHLKPHPRKSRFWAIDGEQEAARFVLRYAWHHFLEDHDLDVSDCPFAGLLG